MQTIKRFIRKMRKMFFWKNYGCNNCYKCGFIKDGFCHYGYKDGYHLREYTALFFYYPQDLKEIVVLGDSFVGIKGECTRQLYLQS